jgi:hypothetical protein
MFERLSGAGATLRTAMLRAARSLFKHAARVKLIVALGISSMGASCPAPTPVPPPKPGAWLVFLCQASDNASQPHPIQFYKELFDESVPNLVTAFFRTMSGGAVDVSGTEVYGWFKMTVDSSTLDPAKRNNGTNPNRSQTAQDCKSAGAAAFLASGKMIDPTRYAGFIAVINVPVDAGETGTELVANQFESASFYQHEMLHTMGLDHSNRMSNDQSADHVWELGADKTYEDPWDIMSFRKFIFENPAGTHDITGPELQIAYRQKLGWIPASRVFVKDTADRSRTTLNLAPVSETFRPGPLMARIDVVGAGASYVVEYRTKSEFDGGIPAPGAGVVVRELRRNGQTYLVSRQGAVAPYPAITMSGFVAGEQFTDAGNFLSITVDAITPQFATITIDPAFATPAKLGDICGNKYVGQIRPCPPGSICDARRTPPIVTVDYFCQ